MPHRGEVSSPNVYLTSTCSPAVRNKTQKSSWVCWSTVLWRSEGEGKPYLRIYLGATFVPAWLDCWSKDHKSATDSWTRYCREESGEQRQPVKPLFEDIWLLLFCWHVISFTQQDLHAPNCVVRIMGNEAPVPQTYLPPATPVHCTQPVPNLELHCCYDPHKLCISHCPWWSVKRLLFSLVAARGRWRSSTDQHHQGELWTFQWEGCTCKTQHRESSSHLIHCEQKYFLVPEVWLAKSFTHCCYLRWMLVGCMLCRVQVYNKQLPTRHNHESKPNKHWASWTLPKIRKRKIFLACLW